MGWRAPSAGIDAKGVCAPRRTMASFMGVCTFGRAACVTRAQARPLHGRLAQYLRGFFSADAPPIEPEAFSVHSRSHVHSRVAARLYEAKAGLHFARRAGALHWSPAARDP